MSDQLSRGLAELIDDEATGFGATKWGTEPERGVVAVRRARRLRAAGLAATSVAAVAVVAVGANLALNVQNRAVEPAGSSTTSVLLSHATPRTSAEPDARPDAQAGIRCTWADGESASEVAQAEGVDSHAIIMDDCDAVWVGDAPLIEATTDLSFGGTTNANAEVTVRWSITNVSETALAIDAEAVAPAFEIPDLRIDTVGGNDRNALVAKNLWTSDTERFTLLTSEAGTATVAPGETLWGTATLTVEEYVDALMHGAVHTVFLRIPLAAEPSRSLILETPTGELTASDLEGAA